MKNIFVPVDFSTCSNNALKYALELSKRQKARIHAVHGFSANAEVISSDFITPFQGVPGTLSSDQINDFITDRVKQIDKQLSEIKELGTENGVEITTYKIDSNLFEDLAAKAKELSCDLVIMGSHGSKGIEETLIGSNAQKFVRHSVIPVLVIKAKPSTLKNVAFFSTFTQEGEKNIFMDFKKLFNLEDVYTHFVYVNTPSNFLSTPIARQRIDGFIDGVKPDNFNTHIYNETSVEEGIVGFAENNNIDLIVLATHGYSGIKKFFHHSYTESVINHVDYPVLSFSLKQD